MKIKCIKCKSELIIKAGFKKLREKKIQRFKCKSCSTFFTGKEKYSRLSEKMQVRIATEFRDGKSLNQLAFDFNVRLYTIQYIINKIRKNNPENEKKYQDRMKNRIRTKQEIHKINKYYQKSDKFGRTLTPLLLPTLPTQMISSMIPIQISSAIPQRNSTIRVGQNNIMPSPPPNIQMPIPTQQINSTWPKPPPMLTPEEYSKMPPAPPIPTQQTNKTWPNPPSLPSHK